MTSRLRLRSMLRNGPMVVAPGAYDCITARLIEQAGFPAVYRTGAGPATAAGRVWKESPRLLRRT
jgi:2-methylisocitrate lyase-like PEP mutase family enzyme